MKSNLRSLPTGDLNNSNIINVNTLSRVLGTTVDITTQRYNEFRFFYTYFFSQLILSVGNMDLIDLNRRNKYIRFIWDLAGDVVTFTNNLQRSVKMRGRTTGTRKTRRVTSRQTQAQEAA